MPRSQAYKLCPVSLAPQIRNMTDQEAPSGVNVGEEVVRVQIRSVTDEIDSPFKCRYYEDKYPKVDQLVMVNVVNVENLGAYVQLLEYNDIEGMVLLSELSRRRIRSINKLIRVNRKEVVMVLRVDREKGCVSGQTYRERATTGPRPLP